MSSNLAKLLSAGLLAIATQTAAQASIAQAAEIGVQLEISPAAPPPPREEMVPPPPEGRTRAVAWVHGRWRWDGHGWAWEPGHYMERPRRDARWEEGHWDHRPEGFVWVEGRWN